MEEFTLICLIYHPTIDPSIITNKLALKPNIIQKNGDQIVTPKGKKMGGVYSGSKWSHKIELDNSESLNNKFIFLIDHLFLRKDFFCTINDEGGSSIIYLNLSNPESFGFNINVETMKKIVNMKMDFGFEIFN